jgi:murein DD-endopeptidase MepM/ murein hydrolase activator NlpD
MTSKKIIAKLNAAKKHLSNTTQSGKAYGRTGRGSEWRAAYRQLNEIIAALTPKPPAVPNLGPVFKGGKSVLAHDLTHATSGLSRYPAFDDAFKEGTPIIAPEPLTVTRDSSSRPGDAFYARGASGLDYWFAHLAIAPRVGTKFAKGAVVGKVGPNTIGGGPHVHVGINIDHKYGAGKQLAHRGNYTHGAPTVGAQLKALEGR